MQNRKLLIGVCWILLSRTKDFALDRKTILAQFAPSHDLATMRADRRTRVTRNEFAYEIDQIQSAEWKRSKGK